MSMLFSRLETNQDRLFSDGLGRSGFVASPTGFQWLSKQALMGQNRLVGLLVFGRGVFQGDCIWQLSRRGGIRAGS